MKLISKQPSNTSLWQMFSGKAIFRSSLLCAALLLSAPTVSAFEITEWRFQTSLYTKHWDPDPEHVNNSKMLNLEFTTESKWLYGFAWFDNSFGQQSQYLYAGRQWPLFKKDWAYFKLTGGLLHGYKEPYEDKIPLNGLGVAPAIVPAFGLKYKRVLVEFQILGAAAGVITAGFNFGQKSRKTPE
ncbi:MAG: sn-glycerol-3-phosphate transporter [Xanthomonadales bacterium]|nr:sn-glycerol-3-phosphate transporter [Xanthomonadales bacterium]